MLPDLTARPRWFVLDGQTPRVAVSVVAWAEWFSHHGRDVLVAVTHVAHVTITTRFTGIDRTFGDGGPPLLFETVATDDATTTVSIASVATWAEALERHGVAVTAFERVLCPEGVTRERPPAWLTFCRATMRRAVPFFTRTKESPTCQSEL